MRGSLPWAVMATVPFVVGAGYYLNTADALASQSAPTAAEHAETVEAAKLHDCVSSTLLLRSHLVLLTF